MTKLFAATRAGRLHCAWPTILPGTPMVTWPGHIMGRWNTLKYRILALTIIGLVLLTAAGWALLGARELAVFRNTGSPAIINALTPGVLQAQAVATEMPGSATSAANRTDQINPTALMPYWMAIDLLIFVALGFYLRWELGRKS